MKSKLIKAKAGQDLYRLRCISTVGVLLIDPIPNMSTAKSPVDNSPERNLPDQIRTFPDNKGERAPISRFSVKGCNHGEEGR
jgi:hypothetical protein